MPSEKSTSNAVSPGFQRFRELLDDVSQIQGLFLEEMRALNARVRELETRDPFPHPVLTQPSIPDLGTCATYYESMEGIIRGWSHGAASLYGYSAEEILGKSSFTLSPAQCHGLLPGTTAMLPIYARIRKGGQIFHVNALHTAIEDAECMTLGYLVQEIAIVCALDPGAES